MINYSDYEIAVAIINIHDKAQEQRKTLPSELSEAQIKNFIDTQFSLRYRALYTDMNEHQKSVYGSKVIEEIVESAKAYLLVYNLNETFERDLKRKEVSNNKNKI